MDNVGESVEHTDAHTYIYSDACTGPPLRAAVPTPMAPRKRAPTRVRTRARIGGAAAHNRPRRTEARPSASAVVRATGPRAAHTEAMFDTDAVFHAPMFALNAHADWNACEPSHPRSTATERARMCRRGCVGARSRIYIRMHVPSRPSARPYLHPWPRASECLHVCARARASALPPRTTGRAASKPRRARPP